MFFRMLKKDLKTNKSLNIFIFFTMIISAIVSVISVIFLYSTFAGFNRSYSASNSTDGFIITKQSLIPNDEKHLNTIKWFSNRSEIKSFNCTEVIPLNSNNIKNEKTNLDDKLSLVSFDSYLIKQPRKTNLVYNLKDEPFTVPNGCIAIPQYLLMSTQIKIGDKLYLTTQLGNTYTFTVSDIFKDSSIYMYRRFILSDSDYDYIAAESPIKYNNYEFLQNDFADISVFFKLQNDYQKAIEENNLEKIQTHYILVDFEGSKLITSIVGILTGGIAFFLMLTIFMTLKFTLRSIIKKEERELGTLKAIGVESLSFKWLFAAKFIAFSFISGIIGIFAGIPLSRILLNQLMINIITPAKTTSIILAVITGIITTALIIYYIFISLRRINKISIMNAIHGENRGEHFNKLPGISLNKCKHISSSLFLAISDLLGQFKHYIFLILSYVFGFAIILLVFQIKDTVLSWDFLHNNQCIGQIDFYIDLPDETMQKYLQKTNYSLKGVNQQLNKELAANDIPAFIETLEMCDAYLVRTENGEEKEYLAGIIFGDYNPNHFYYKKGSVPPTLKNEAAINYIMAKQFGIKLGDTVSVKYTSLNDDHLTTQSVTKDFIITAFTDLCSNAVVFTLNPQVDDIAPFTISTTQNNTSRILSCIIDAPEAEKPYYFEKIEKLYGKENVQSTDEYLYNIFLKDNESIFVALRNIISFIVIFILILNTALYEKIFIDEEACEIALLKSTGFSLKDIKLWHFFRIAILIVSAFVLGSIITLTAGNAFCELMIQKLMYASGFHLKINPLVDYAILPIVIFALISATLLILLNTIKSINIWRIKDE